MGEEIDLRAYVKALFRRWWLVAGMALLGVLVGLIFGFVSPVQYEATAVVIVTQAKYQLQFDPRVETAPSWVPAYKAFPRLATSDSVLQAIVSGYQPTPAAHLRNWNLTELSGMVKASSESDPSLIALTVRSGSAQDAAAIANIWADSLVVQGNEIYGQNLQDVTFFETQVSQAEKALNDADAALIDFQARNNSTIISGQLASQQQAQTDFLTTQRTIAQMMQDVSGLRRQLAALPAGQASSVGDELTALLLQIRAFNAITATGIQLQVSTDTALASRSVDEQIAFLDSLAKTLQDESADISGRLKELEPAILSLQQQLQAATAESDRLTQARNLAQETHLTMARKLDEARIGAQEQNSLLQVGSHAAVPETPAAPRRLRVIAIAGVVGLMLGVFGALAAEWWLGQGAA